MTADTPNGDEAQSTPAAGAGEHAGGPGEGDRGGWIPKPRFDEVLVERNQLREQLAKVAGGEKAPKGKPGTDGAEPKIDGTNLTMDQIIEATVKALEKRDDPLREEVMAQKAAREFNLTVEQAAEVRKVAKEKGLGDEDALVLARHRNPDLFGQPNPRGYAHGVHGSVRPSGASPERTSQPTDYMKKIQEATSPEERQRYVQKEIGRRLQRFRTF